MGITRTLAKRIGNYDNTDSFASRLRARRAKPLIELIDKIYAIHGCVSIVDIGGTRNYWNILPSTYLKERDVTMTIVNLPGTNPHDNDERFKYADGDACAMTQFDDFSFDIAHSNSVIEHVGDMSAMESFSKEIKRLAPAYFVQTPNYWFPIEPHFMAPFFHWLPESIRARLVMKLSLGNRSSCSEFSEALKMVRSIKLLNSREFKLLFDDAKIIREKLLFMTKSMVAMRDV